MRSHSERVGWRILDLNGVLNRSPKLNELIGFVRQQFQAELFRVHVGVERPAEARSYFTVPQPGTSIS